MWSRPIFMYGCRECATRRRQSLTTCRTALHWCEQRSMHDEFNGIAGLRFAVITRQLLQEARQFTSLYPCHVFDAGCRVFSAPRRSGGWVTGCPAGGNGIAHDCARGHSGRGPQHQGTIFHGAQHGEYLRRGDFGNRRRADSRGTRRVQTGTGCGRYGRSPRCSLRLDPLARDGFKVIPLRARSRLPLRSPGSALRPARLALSRKPARLPA